MESANGFLRNKLVSKGQVSHSKTDKRKTTLLSLPSLRPPTPETSLFRMDGGRLTESFRRGPLINHSAMKTVNKDQRTPSLSLLYHGDKASRSVGNTWLCKKGPLLGKAQMPFGAGAAVSSDVCSYESGLWIQM